MINLGAEFQESDLASAPDKSLPMNLSRATMKKVARGFGLERREVAGVAAIIAVILLTLVVAVSIIGARSRQATADALKVVLDSVNNNLYFWAHDRQRFVSIIASDGEVVASVNRLVEADQRKLRQGPARGTPEAIRRALEGNAALQDLQGYYLIDTSNAVIGSSWDSRRFESHPLTQNTDRVAALWRGKPAWMAVPHANGSTARGQGDNENAPIAFLVASPIYDAFERPQALLVLSFNPAVRLHTLLSIARFGKTGETYIFDRDGMMLSPSRFATELEKSGKLEAGQSSIFNVRLEDPGNGNTQKRLSRAPLTYMATQAIAGVEGINVEGYRDYRGVNVFGAWSWDEHLDAGIAVEQDEDEALAIFEVVRNLSIAGALLTIAGILLLTRLVAVERRLVRNSRNRLSAVVEGALNSILIIDVNGVIKSANPATERIFGHDVASLVGKNVSVLMPEQTGKAHAGYVINYLQSGRSPFVGKPREVIAMTKDGKHFPVELSVARLDLDTGVHFAGTIQDLTERKAAEAALQQLADALRHARDDAEAANRAKSSFLAAMSHEIRTPLNGVVGAIDLMEHTTLEVAQRDLLRTARESSMSLLAIIDDILDFSKIEAGRLELERVPLHLAEVCEAVGDSLREIAYRKKVELLVYCDPAIPAVVGDGVRLRQILFNLTGNAVKFSANQQDRHGRVVVRVLLDEVSASQAKVTLSVQDNGIGMSAAVQERLFNPFTQAEQSTTRRFGGTGLGLVITRRLVDMMEGRIDVRSVEGEGSTFSISLSLAVSSDIQAAAPAGGLKELIVLLVCADPTVRPMLEGYLRHTGARVVDADPDMLRELYVAERVRHGDKKIVVVQDVGVDESAAHGVRSALDPERKDGAIRFLLVQRGRRRTPRKGDEDCLQIDLNAMRRRSYITAVAALAGLESPELPELEVPKLPDFEVPTVEAARKANRLILLADDNETNLKVISHQLWRLGHAVELAENGQQALEMWRQGNYALLLTDCHMPVMDGYQLSQAIRQEEKPGQHMPIIAITADALKGTSARCLAAGMDDYLTKPLQLSLLHLTLEKWMSGGNERPESVAIPESQVIRQSGSTEGAANDGTNPGEQLSGAMVSGPSDVPVEGDALAAVLGSDDPSMLAVFYQDFLKTSAAILIDLHGAVEQKAWQLASGQAHKLKSSARTIGANALADCCYEIELAGKAGEVQALMQAKGRIDGLYSAVRAWIHAWLSARETIEHGSATTEQRRSVVSE